MTIGERIKKLRKALDLTQQTFCNRIGLQRNSISLVESGKRNISQQAVLSICREFHVNEAWLRTGDGEMFHHRDDAEELAEMINRLLSGETAEFKKRLITVLAALNEQQWEFLQDKLFEIVGMRNNTPATEQSTMPHETEEPFARHDGVQLSQKRQKMLHDYEQELLAEQEAEERSSASLVGNADIA